MKNDYYTIYKKYNELIQKLNNKIERLDNDIICMEKMIDNLGKNCYSNKNKIKLVLFSILTVTSVCACPYIALNQITISEFSIFQNFIIRSIINSVVISSIAIGTLNVARNFPSNSKKIDIDEVAINIQKEIDKKYYEKNKTAKEIEKITSIKKDIDDLKNFYHTEYKINFPEEKINFQKKKSR